MEKYCPNCNRKFGLNNNYCSNCATKLKIRYSDIDIPQSIREEVYIRDGYRCKICGASKYSDNISLEIDYIVPIDQGGSKDIDNLQTLCPICYENKDNLVLSPDLKIKIENKENELEVLNVLLSENEKKLEYISDEDELIDIKFEITKLKEDISIVNDELSQIKSEYQENLDKKSEYEQKIKLFKKLYVVLTDDELNFLSDNFNLPQTSKAEKLRYLCDYNSQITIQNALEEYRKKEFNKVNKLMNDGKANVIMEKLSFSGSKEDLINHLIDNYSNEEILDLINESRKELSARFCDIVDGEFEKCLQVKFSFYSQKELINYLVDNVSEEELHNLKEIFFKLDEDINDKFKEYLCDKFEIKGSKRDLINYLISHYNENELFGLLMENNEELFNKFSEIVEGNFERFLYVRFSFDSKDRLIKYLVDNFNEKELLNLKEFFIKLDDIIYGIFKEYLFLKLYIIDESKFSLINYLINNCPEDKIFNLKELFYKYYSILDGRFEKFLNINLSFDGTRVELINYLINNCPVDKIFNLKELFYKYYSILDGRFEKFLNINLSFDGTRVELINYLMDNVSEKDLVNLKKLFIKLDKCISDKFNVYLCDKLEVKGSKLNLIDYLSSNYDEKEIFELIKINKKELFDKFYNNVDAKFEEFLYVRFSFAKSKDDLINNFVDNITEEEFSDLKELYDEYNSIIDDDLQLLLLNRFSLNGDKLELINYLVDHLSPLEVSNFKKLFIKLNNDINTKIEEVLCLELSFEGSKSELIIYLINNYSEDELFTILKEVRRKLFIGFHEILDKNFELLLRDRFSFEGSRFELINFLIDNYSLNEISDLRQLFDKLENLIDGDVKVWLDLELSFEGSKVELIIYLINNYSEEEIFNLHTFKNQLLIHKLEKEINQNILPALCKKVSYGIRDKNQLILYLINNYSEEEIDKEIKWVKINMNR